MTRLHFSPGRHIYTLDDERVPSVSQVKNAVGSDAGGMVHSAAKHAASWALTHMDELAQYGEDRWLREAANAYRPEWARARDYGTAVHSIAQRLTFGEPVSTSDPDTGEPYPDDVVRMGEQTARFMDAWDVTADTAIVEQCVFHDELRYAGTLDLCFVVSRGKYKGERWLIDYKTGASGVYPETAVQLTAYARATHVQIGDRDLLMPPVNRCAALWVRPDSWEVLPVKSGDDMWEVVKHGLALVPFTKLDRDELIGGALSVPAGSAA